MTRDNENRLPARTLGTFHIALDSQERVIKCGFTQLVDEALTLPVFRRSPGLDCIQGFQLAKVPSDGLVCSTDGPAYVARRAPVGVLGKEAKDFKPEGIDTEQAHDICHPQGRGLGRLDIAGHPFIVSHTTLFTFY